MKEEEKINDLVYFDNMKIIQNKNYFNFSLDSIILPNYVQIEGNKKIILDICTGNAPIPLVLSTKTKSKIIGIELQKKIFDLAVKSVELNNLSDQIKIINEDIKKYSYENESDIFDVITCNPPYFRNCSTSIRNKNDIKTIARHEVSITLEEIIKISKKLLKNNGDLYLVHRTDRLVEMLKLMNENNIEPKRIRFIYPKINSKSNLFLICGKKNGNTGLIIDSPLYVHNDDGSYTDEVLSMFKEG